MIARAILVAILLIGSVSPALAFHEVASFTRSANSGGAAGSFFTGSPRYKSYDCRICHNDGEERISIELSSEPPELFAQSTYRSEGTYLVTVKLVGEHRGLASAFNPNTFTAEFLDRAGATIGILAPSVDPVTEIADGGNIAIAEGFGNGETEWSFVWNAPAQLVPATFYIAMLDGDGASDAERRFIDPYKDDVATRVVELCPAGVDCAPPPPEPGPTSPAGCQTVTAGGSAAMFSLILLLLVVAGARSSRRRERVRRELPQRGRRDLVGLDEPQPAPALLE